MSYQRVINYIRKNTAKKTIVFVQDGKLRCTPHDNWMAKIVMNSNHKKLQMVGMYTSDVDESYVVEDLDHFGFYD